MDYLGLALLPPCFPDEDNRNQLLFDGQGPMMCPNNDSQNIAVSQQPTQDDVIINDNMDLLDLQPLDGSAQNNHVDSTLDWESILNDMGFDVPQPQGRDTESADAMASQPGPVELPPPARKRPPPAEALASEGHGAIAPGDAVVQEPNPISTQQEKAKTRDDFPFPVNTEGIGDDWVYSFTSDPPLIRHPPTPAPSVSLPCPSPVPQPAPIVLISCPPVPQPAQGSSATPSTSSSGGKERVRNRPKKIPKYLQPPCEDEKEEMKRQNACKARLNRELKKKKDRQLVDELNEVTADRDRLRAELELSRADNNELEARLKAIRDALKVKG